VEEKIKASYLLFEIDIYCIMYKLKLHIVNNFRSRSKKYFKKDIYISINY